MSKQRTAALVLFGLAVCLMLKSSGSTPAAVRPIWTGIKWGFPIDQWGGGKAFQCDAVACGTDIDVFVRPEERRRLASHYPGTRRSNDPVQGLLRQHPASLCRQVDYSQDRRRPVVIIEYEVHGTILATGVKYSNRFCSIIKIENRKIAEWRDYIDSLAAWNALTALAR